MSETPAQHAESVAHPKDCICFDGEYCEKQIDAYEALAGLVKQTFDLDDVIADQAIEAMYDPTLIDGEVSDA